ncbi:hypothetical protein B0H12DRAFT_1148844, partial [Mycena haematopus]
MASSEGAQFDWGQSSPGPLLATSTSLIPSDKNSNVAVLKSRSPLTASHHAPPSPVASVHAPQVPTGSDTSQFPPEIQATLNDIQTEDFYTTGVRSETIPNISSATWLNLKLASESMSQKLEYWSSSETLVVTHPSGIHEALHVLCKPFTQIAHAYEKDFLTEWNRDIRIILPDDQYMDLIPDFAFGEKGHPIPKYRIIFECAWAQSDAELDT